MKLEVGKHVVGEFKIKRTMGVWDPCYGSGTTLPALAGKWIAEIEVVDQRDGWGKRVARLTVRHESHPDAVLDEFIDTEGVDSGQMGFYDSGALVSEGVSTSEDLYNDICELTLGDMHAGILEDLGVVSSSGYGDGGYPLHVARNKDKRVVAAEVKFIYDEESEGEDD